MCHGHKIFLPSQQKQKISIAQGLDAAWVVAARQRDDDYKEKIRQVTPFSIETTLETWKVHVFDIVLKIVQTIL